MTERDTELLREHGLRVTQGRLAVLDQLERLPHADAESVHRALVAAGNDTSVQSVHNVTSSLPAVVTLVYSVEPFSGSGVCFRVLFCSRTRSG